MREKIPPPLPPLFLGSIINPVTEKMLLKPLILSFITLGELSDDGSEKRAGGEDEEVLSVASLSKEDLSARVRREATRAMGSFRQTRGEKQVPVRIGCKRSILI